MNPPQLTLAERDRRWAGMRAIMAAAGLDAMVAGSFQGRERLESYLIDDFLDSVVVLPLASPPVLLAFSTSRVSRIHESARRGEAVWVDDIRIDGGGAGVARVLAERGIAGGRIGLVGLGPTAPGEMEGLLPLGFWRNLVVAAPDAEFVDVTRDFTDFVLLKSAEELALMRHAARVTEEACAAMIAACRPGATEAEVYADILHAIHRRGCGTRYPFLSLQSGPDNIAWGEPRWILRAEPPRILARGDLVQAEIHTQYGGQEAQVQMSVALDPISAEARRCEEIAGQAWHAGLASVRPGATIADVVRAMEAPISEGGCWAKTPLVHTTTFGATGFTALGRAQIAGTREGTIEGQARVGIRRGDLVLRPGMCLELEPNACIGTVRVNIGGIVVVTETGAECLNTLATEVHHATS